MASITSGLKSPSAMANRHEFTATTELGAALEMAREQEATLIEIENTLN